ncbi:hypothetical protein Z946_3680 [Sulfitobacter noctilucicola]|uniref:DUF192 domain-containing protein n=1 Tax=Sulfitobacter noctilucicola TaxID=1342301 RepID=A0A7W6Q3D2_9RHOB|nr:DUF192 domain-containing protein [Sulfitobacter noctilucicola]KIN64788.1 hypothetical protein Z946_3680 [Sulfitobacter noctilucicola]MBB4174065.1 hypothetical protein [Sulfitobacter noctilucicola]
MGNGATVRHFTKRLSAGLLAFCALVPAVAAQTCDPQTVELRGDWGLARFTVEIADDPAEQAQGLMHRTEMPLGAGMYFVNAAPRTTSFWMRNTLIPLDMLFIDASGIVQHIHHNAIPLDESAIPGGDDILTVLEINGGLAARLGIEKGSEVRHPAHAAWSPVWPC